jgi:hypothetical protein
MRYHGCTMGEQMAKYGLDPAILGWRRTASPAVLAAGVGSIDAALGGWPRGRISEIVGPASSGRTTLLHRLLARATARGEVCALVDALDAFDPVTAELSGVDLARLTWVRCGGHLEHVMRAADLLLHAGGLGVVALDLGGVLEEALGRIPAPYWFRFRRAVEASETICVVLAPRPVAKSCSALIVETGLRRAGFTPRLFCALDCRVAVRKPWQAAESVLHVEAM